MKKNINYKKFLELFINAGYVLDYTDAEFYSAFEIKKIEGKSKGNALLAYFDSQISKKKKLEAISKLFTRYENSFVPSILFKTSKEISEKHKSLYPELKKYFLDISPKNRILIIGNGFDLAMKLNTKYSDFVTFCCLVHIFYNFPNIEEKEVDFIKNKEQFYTDKRAHLKIFIQAYYFVKNKKEDAKQMEYHMQYVLYKDFLYEVLQDSYDLIFNHDYSKSKAINIYENVINAVQKGSNNLKNWMDVEKFIDYYVTGRNSYKDVYNYDGKPLVENKKIENDCILGLRYFCNDFSLYLNCITEKFIAVLNSIGNDYLNILPNIRGCYKCNIKDEIYSEQFDNFDYIFNYNYTDVAKNVFCNPKGSKIIYRKEVPNVIHINGQVTKNNLVFGFFSDFSLDETINKFTKDCQRNSKSINRSSWFDVINNNPFDLTIFGFSCSVTDTDTLKEILLSNNLNMVNIMCYSQEELLSIESRIKAITSPNYETIRNKFNFYVQTFAPNLDFLS